MVQAKPDILTEIGAALKDSNVNREQMAKLLARASDEISALRKSHARAMDNLTRKNEVEYEIQLRRCQKAI